LIETARRYPEIYVIQMNIDEDHVHLQLEIAPNISVATAVQLLKANASRYLKYHFPFIDRIYPDGHIWSVGYFCSTIGVNEQIIRKYIEGQGRRDYPQEVQQGFVFS
jgi:putative transposase